MKKSFYIILILFNFGNLYSQTNYINVGQTHSVAKLYLANYKFVKANNLILINDSTIKFTNCNSGAIEQLNINKVQILSVRNGTHASSYGLIGAGVGLASCLIGIASAENSYPNSGVNYAPLVLGFIGGGALIGTILGACNSRWERLYFRQTNKSLSYSVIPEFYNGVCSMKLTLKF